MSKRQACLSVPMLLAKSVCVSYVKYVSGIGRSFSTKLAVVMYNNSSCKLLPYIRETTTS